ncbi:MAG: hypothetical protein HY594_02945 [Candidatus Omnitrophica bacterium]|nr:hypothetical protein [Candidatus Omnitrophota bacterium]
MQIECDICHKAVEDNLCQMMQQGPDILYVCPECFMKAQEGDPEHQP